jgi:hypothetical protein
MPTPSDRRLEIVEPGRIPPLSLIFGFGPMLPLVAGLAAALLGVDPPGFTATQATVLWGAAILLFLSGVRRGLSFRTPGGPTLAQLLTSFGLFWLGLGALVALPASPRLALALLALGYLAVLILDPIAASRAEVPPNFARLRPPQMAIAVASLVALALLQPA